MIEEFALRAAVGVVLVVLIALVWTGERRRQPSKRRASMKR
jgi:hypothetical protein